MSLIGSLEDLGLGDILQIINLSKKSGVLSIRGALGEGRIVFQEGMVRTAFLKGGPEDLSGLLVERGFVSDVDFASARETANARGLRLDEALAASGAISAERIDSLRREAVETAVARMFSWTCGDFSFDIGGSDDWKSGELYLETGVNAQYLAMESLRVRDESDRDSEAGAADETDTSGLNLDLSAEEMFGVVADEPASQPQPIEEIELNEEADGLPDPFSMDDPPSTRASDGDSAIDALVSATARLVTATEKLESEDFGQFESTAEILKGQLVESGEAAADLEVLDTSLDFDLGAEDVIGDDDTETAPVAELLIDDELELDDDESTAPDLADVIAKLPPEPLDAPEPLKTPEPLETSKPMEVPSPRPAPAAPILDDLPPVVVIDPRLWVLEWARQALAPAFDTVHIFQRSQEGLGRIRQYLARAQSPMLLVSPDIEGNPLSGISDANDFVRRLQKQAPRMLIRWLVASDDDSSENAEVEKAHRPDSAEIAGDPRNPGNMGLQSGLREFLLEQISERRSGRGTRGGESAESAEAGDPMSRPSLDQVSSEALERLKEATRTLSDAASQVEVLPLVMRFAFDSFGRVAMFMVRGDQVNGMAQVGLEEQGGPDDFEMRAIIIDKSDCSWFTEVIDQRHPVRGAVVSEGDRRLLDRFGGAHPDECYVAPILSAGEVVALVYADGPRAAAASWLDTGAIEVVLHHAGLALDRAALERALAMAENEA